LAEAKFKISVVTRMIQSMASTQTIFQTNVPRRRATLADGVILLTLAVLFYAGLSLATHLGTNQPVINQIFLSPRVLPLYTLYSITRMLAAYVLSFLFTMFYGRMAAYNKRAERIMLPILDVLQSVPILSFLPVVLLSLTAIMPQRLAVELASIVLIFTSQAWNMTFAWYQSLNTIPKELREASAIFRLNTWMNFKSLELPFAAIPLIWNSMMSWAGGWFFLMAAEIFTVGQHSFRLPGLGSYLQTAALQKNYTALAWGLGVLMLVIIVMDQWIWRPMLAWADRFKIEMSESDNPPTSWFYDLSHAANIVRWFRVKVTAPLWEWLDSTMIRRSPMGDMIGQREERPGSGFYVLTVVGAGLLIYGGYRVAGMFIAIPLQEWGSILIGILATGLRVFIALVIAMLLTIPLGYAIGSNPRTASWLQPIVQVVASLPATALFPLLIVILAQFYGGLNIAAVLLMLMGTMWYLLFNIIAGAATIPQDLKYTTALLGIRKWERWRTLILPSLFPFIITGAITAGGGAWNASIVAEYLQYGDKTISVTGIGSVIASATAGGNYPLLLVATLSMILTVVLINRLVWRRFYRIAEDRYKME
jgi:NitT/TauT family transport system permease protein